MERHRWLHDWGSRAPISCAFATCMEVAGYRCLCNICAQKGIQGGSSRFVKSFARFVRDKAGKLTSLEWRALSSDRRCSYRALTAESSKPSSSSGSMATSTSAPVSLLRASSLQQDTVTRRQVWSKDLQSVKSLQGREEDTCPLEFNYRDDPCNAQHFVCVLLSIVSFEVAYFLTLAALLVPGSPAGGMT